MGTDINPVIEYCDEGEWHLAVNREGLWYQRCYVSFAILADMRNGWGVKPIAATRGIPHDWSPELELLHKAGDTDGCSPIGEHSFSWVTLAEVEAYESGPMLFDKPGDLDLYAKATTLRKLADSMRLVWDAQRWHLGENPRIPRGQAVRLVFGFDS